MTENPSRTWSESDQKAIREQLDRILEAQGSSSLPLSGPP